MQMKPFDQYTLLVVDDEVDLRDALAFNFERHGFQVRTASSGNDAFKIVCNEPVHVVVSDIRMPDGDGFDLLKKIKNKSVSLPMVMFMTGQSDYSIAEAYDKGAEAVFAKPFKREALLDSVVRCLQSMEEKLSFRNARVDTTIEVGLHFRQSGFSVNTEILNIGRGGVFARLEDKFPMPMESVDFSLKSPTKPSIKIQGSGIVRWVREKEIQNPPSPKGCGIEFLELNPSCRNEVIELINALKTKAFIPMR